MIKEWRIPWKNESPETLNKETKGLSSLIFGRTMNILRVSSWAVHLKFESRITLLREDAARRSNKEEEWIADRDWLGTSSHKRACLVSHFSTPRARTGSLHRPTAHFTTSGPYSKLYFSKLRAFKMKTRKQSRHLLRKRLSKEPSCKSYERRSNLLNVDLIKSTRRTTRGACLPRTVSEQANGIKRRAPGRCFTECNSMCFGAACTLVAVSDRIAVFEDLEKKSTHA